MYYAVVIAGIGVAAANLSGYVASHNTEHYLAGLSSDAVAGMVVGIGIGVMLLLLVKLRKTKA